jgi:hypothetical protein
MPKVSRRLLLIPTERLQADLRSAFGQRVSEEASEIAPPVQGRAPLARSLVRRFTPSPNKGRACREAYNQRPDGTRRQLRSFHCRTSFLISAILQIMTGFQQVPNRMTRSGATLKYRGNHSGNSLSNRNNSNQHSHHRTP